MLWIFLSFTEKMGKNIGTNISKSLSSKYSQKLLDHAKWSATYTLKTTSKTAIQKTAEATGDLIGNTIADKFTIVSKASLKNNSETKEEKYLSPQLRQKFIDDLRLKEEYFWWIKIKRRKLKEEN